MSRRTGIYAQGGKIRQPLYTGSYSVSLVGAYYYMYLLTSGTLTIQSKGGYDIFAVGGGGRGGHGGGSADDIMPASGGGGGGYTATRKAVAFAPGASIPITIGAGSTAYSSSRSNVVRGGTTSVAISPLLSALGGISGIGTTTLDWSGYNGGSGGGAVGSQRDGGAGGSDGGNGGSSSGSGGQGQGTTTRAFGEGNNTLYAGGGGGGTYYSGIGGAGGAGGGGSGASHTAGAANTGGGGGGGAYNSYAPNGGSGLVIIRWAA